jgi:hypothetical protein
VGDASFASVFRTPNRVRRKLGFESDFKLIWSVQSYGEKYFYLRKTEIMD